MKYYIQNGLKAAGYTVLALFFATVIVSLIGNSLGYLSSIGMVR